VWRKRTKRADREENFNRVKTGLIFALNSAEQTRGVKCKRVWKAQSPKCGQKEIVQWGTGADEKKGIGGERVESGHTVKGRKNGGELRNTHGPEKI